jgi:hypothetical protein
MKVFTCTSPSLVAIAIAFNRGHAAKMLAKEFEARGLKFEKKYPITEVVVDKHKPKGQVVVILSDKEKHENA